MEESRIKLNDNFDLCFGRYLWLNYFRTIKSYYTNTMKRFVISYNLVLSKRYVQEWTRILRDR